MSEKIKTRIFINQNLECAQIVIPNETQSHYLNNVLRVNNGDKVAAFDGESGEFLFEILKNNKRNIQLQKISKIKNFYLPPDLWLLFAPVKKDKTDFIIQKSGI